MTFETLIREAQGTSEEILDKVIRYLKFLKKETAEGNASEPEGQKRRPFGIYRGQIKMTEDFNSALNNLWSICDAAPRQMYSS